jgi:TRAP-type mannitol/chloroaromatic compound transport system permease small subunit
MTEFPNTRLSRTIDGTIRSIGKIVSWVWIVLLLVIVFNVVLRYLFSEGRIEFEEIQWHLYSVGFLFGLPFAFVTDSHIRVDVLRERFSDQTRAWIELYGLLLLFFPFVLFVIINAFPFISYSYTTSEISEAPAGLPYRWLIKGVLLIGFFMLFVAGISRLSRVFCYLFGWPEQLGTEAESTDENHSVHDGEIGEADVSR